MLESLTKHAMIAFCLAVMLEELGLPMPIPTDVLIILAGVNNAHSFSLLAVTYVLMSVASALGSTGLYFIVRRGGRPLVERWGRYVHLGPKQLARAEQMLERSGWWGIAGGRAVPGLRYVTVIACGLLKIPYQRYITAHFVGSSVYIMVFLWLGAHFGPRVLDIIHLPHLNIRLVGLLVITFLLPIGTTWLARHGSDTEHFPKGQGWRAVLLANFVAASGLTATWATGFELAEHFGAEHLRRHLFDFAHLMIPRLFSATGAMLLIYAVLLITIGSVSMLYFEFVLLHLPRRLRTGPAQVVTQLVLHLVVLVPLMIYALVGLRPTDQRIVVLMIAVGLLGNAITSTAVRTLVLARVPRKTSSAIQPLPEYSTSPEIQTRAVETHDPAST